MKSELNKFSKVNYEIAISILLKSEKKSEQTDKIENLDNVEFF